MENNLEFLKSDLASIQFADKGQLGEASRAAVPVLQAFENADISALPMRIGKGFKKQAETEIDQLRKAGLRRVIRITSPKFVSQQNKNSLGFARLTDASREWRECEIRAAVLERYIDIATGECVIEKYDEEATLTIRQSRHIKASDQKKAKDPKTIMYTRENYECPSCGAQIEHIADRTNCPYCGAYITFNFFDWQLDSFYIDMHKSSLLNEVKDAAGKTAVGIAWVISKIVDLLADSWDKKDEKTRKPDTLGHDNRLGAALTVVLFIVMITVIGILAMPWYIRLALGIIVLALIIFEVLKFLKNTEQSRRKKKIVRYSDAYLRSCVYDEIWKGMDIRNLIDFSIDDIIIKSVENTESTTSIELSAAVIKKFISKERKIDIVSEDIGMKLSRARYPERKKTKGKIMEEKICPSCGANFEPDENRCCAYCGYGLKTENYIWQRAK